MSAIIQPKVIAPGAHNRHNSFLIERIFKKPDTRNYIALSCNACYLISDKLWDVHPVTWTCPHCNNTAPVLYANICTGCINTSGVIKPATYVCSNATANHSSNLDSVIKPHGLLSGKCETHKCAGTCVRTKV